MGWRDQVLDVFEQENIIEKRGSFQSASVSANGTRLLTLNYPLELARCDISHRDYVNFALPILLYKVGEV